MQRIMITLCLIGFITIGVKTNAQTKQTPNKTTDNMNTTSSTQPVKDFFAAFSKGDFEGILNSFHNDCSITAVRRANRAGHELYGSYSGKEGVKEFLSNLGNTFNTKAFSVDHTVGEGNVAFASGQFTHEVKSTGKLFSSDWSLMCVIKDGKIYEYHFYEDSAKFLEASSR